MRIYYKDNGNNQGFLVATHDIGSAPSASAYGKDIKTFDGDTVERIGDAPVNGRFDMRPIAIPVESLDALKLIATKMMLQILTDAADTITSKYTQSEQLSWGTKDTAARAYLAKQTLTDTQITLLQAEANASGDTDLDTLCKGIVANAEAFAKISGTLAGLRSSTATSISESKTQADLDKSLADLSEKIIAFFKAVNTPAPAASMSSSSSSSSSNTPSSTSSTEPSSTTSSNTSNNPSTASSNTSNPSPASDSCSSTNQNTSAQTSNTPQSSPSSSNTSSSSNTPQSSTVQSTNTSESAKPTSDSSSTETSPSK